MLARKKKEENTADTRVVLLETATRLFSEYGFDGVSIRLLAKEAGVNMALIAYYFGSKEKLFSAVFEEHIPKFGTRLRSFQKLNIGSWEKMTLIIDGYVDLIFSRGKFSKLMQQELSLRQRPEHSDRIIEAIHKNWVVIQNIVIEGQKKGEFKSDIDIEMTLATMFGTIAQIVNAPVLSAKLMGKLHETEIFSEETRSRTKRHLQQMFKSHLCNPNFSVKER
jgi:AcrR family transcriptional regulator